METTIQVEQQKREKYLIFFLTLLSFHTMNSNFAKFRTNDAVCSREVNVALAGKSHAAWCQKLLFVESLY